MISTRNKSLYLKCLEFRTHGITRDKSKYLNSPSEVDLTYSRFNYPSWYYEMQKLGFNYRITDFQSVLGISQLKRAKENLQKRKKIAKFYNNYFENKKYIINHSKFIKGHAYHLYIIEIKRRSKLYDFLKSKKIFTQVHYFPIHLMPFYKKLNNNSLPNSEKYKNHCLSLPMFPELKKNELNFIVKKIDEFFG